VSLENARAVVFDFDGTLFDLAPVVKAARKRVATLLFSNGFFASRSHALNRIEVLERKHGPYYSSSPYYFAFFDIAKAIFKDKPDQVRGFLDERNTDPDADPVEALVGEMERVYNAEEVEDIRPYPDVLHTLRELRIAGYKLFLVTLGRSRRQRNKIDRLGIAPYLDRIINEGPPAHAYWFSELMESHALSPDELVVVGEPAVVLEEGQDDPQRLEVRSHVTCNPREYLPVAAIREANHVAAKDIALYERNRVNEVLLRKVAMLVEVVQMHDEWPLRRGELSYIAHRVRQFLRQYDQETEDATPELRRL